MKIIKKLKEKKGIGEWVKFYKKNTKERYRGLCVDEIVEISGEYAHRIQKIIWCQHKKGGHWIEFPDSKFKIAIRICYWVISKNKKKIVFGQFATSSNPKLIKNLFKKANKKGFFKTKTAKQAKREYESFMEKKSK